MLYLDHFKYQENFSNSECYAEKSFAQESKNLARYKSENIV